MRQVEPVQLGTEIMAPSDEAPSLLTISADALERIGSLVGEDAHLPLRASFRAARALLSPPTRTERTAMLRTPALAAWAWDLPGFRSAEFLDSEQAKLCALAAGSGSLATLMWLRERGCAWELSTCSSAALGGHLAALQWARDQGCEWCEDVCRSAIRGGHIAVLQWAVRNGCQFDSQGCLYIARQEGRDNMLDCINELAPAYCFERQLIAQLNLFDFPELAELADAGLISDDE